MSSPKMTRMFGFGDWPNAPLGAPASTASSAKTHVRRSRMLLLRSQGWFSADGDPCGGQVAPDTSLRQMQLTDHRDTYFAS